MFKIFRRISAKQLAQAELEEAQRALLTAKTGRDWANSQVAYNEARVKRLTTLVNKL